MRALQRWSATLALVAFFATPALSQPQDRDGMIAAGKQLAAKLASAAKGRAPTLTNGDAALVRKAFDPAGLRTRALTLEIGEVCTTIGEAIAGYAGYARRVTAAEPRPAAAADSLLLGDLQDELALGRVAANVCIQRGFRGVALYLEGLEPGQRTDAQLLAALKQMRGAVVLTIESTLQSAAIPQMRPANRTAMLAAIGEDAPALAASMTKFERERLSERALRYIARATPEAAEQLKAIADAYASPQCDLVCTSAGG